LAVSSIAGQLNRRPPISGDPYKLSPYRLEWRNDLTCGWVLIEHLESHPGDIGAWLKEHRPGKAWGGQWRVVTQHVIAAKGLGA
jgi:hypothetical protein